MNVASINTQMITGLDYRVWLVMVSSWLICIGVFGYNHLRNNIGESQPCPASASISVDGNKGEAIAICQPNRLAIFRLDVAPGAKVQWKFDDGKGQVTGSVAQHSFSSEGNYRVIALVNGRCEYKKEVLVKAVISIEPIQKTVIIFADSLKAMAGSQIRFSGVTNFDAVSYQWTVLPTNDVENGEVVSFAFMQAGKYTVKLVVDSDAANSDQKTIEIVALSQPTLSPIVPGGMPNLKDLGALIPPGMAGGQQPAANHNGSGSIGSTQPPVTPPVVPPKPTAISEESLMEILQAILNEEKEVSELYQYLDYDETTLVEITGKPTMKLSAFCKEKKHRTIETLEFKKDDKNGIQKLKVKLKWKFPFG